MSFVGRWYIYEMDMWTADYFNMECMAYILVDSDYIGKFQFGLVQGDIVGKVHITSGIETFEFRFSATDELDLVTGKGWIQITNDDSIKGEFSFDNGDISGFLASKNKE